MRKIFWFLLCLSITAPFHKASADPWTSIEPDAAGWSAAIFAQAKEFSLSLKPTAVVIVQNGKMIANWVTFPGASVLLPYARAC